MSTVFLTKEDLSERYHPRKRLKGRRGCKGSGPKGSQKKISTKYISDRNPELVAKEGNRVHRLCKKDDIEGKYFDDGNMNEGIEYSTNKKKRWILKNTMEKEGGLIDDGHYWVNEYDIIGLKRTNEEKFQSRITVHEKYHELKKNELKTMSSKKKRKKIRKKREIEKKKREAKNQNYSYNEQNRARNYLRFLKSRKKRSKVVRNKDRKKMNEELKEEENQFEMDLKRKRNLKNKKIISINKDLKEKMIEDLSKLKEEEKLKKFQMNPNVYSFNGCTKNTKKMSYLRYETSKTRKSSEKWDQNATFGVGTRKSLKRRERKSLKKRSRKKNKSKIKNDIKSMLRNKNKVVKMFNK